MFDYPKFISKLVEKSSAVQLTKHVMTNQLDETFQSAQRKFHSTETALLRVQNDIVCPLDQNKSDISLLLDLSAAFDTVDHEILIVVYYVENYTRWCRSKLLSKVEVNH